MSFASNFSAGAADADGGTVTRELAGAVRELIAPEPVWFPATALEPPTTRYDERTQGRSATGIAVNVPLLPGTVAARDTAVLVASGAQPVTRQAGGDGAETATLGEHLSAARAWLSVNKRYLWWLLAAAVAGTVWAVNSGGKGQ